MIFDVKFDQIDNCTTVAIVNNVRVARLSVVGEKEEINDSFGKRAFATYKIKFRSSHEAFHRCLSIPDYVIPYNDGDQIPDISTFDFEKAASHHAVRAYFATIEKSRC